MLVIFSQTFDSDPLFKPKMFWLVHGMFASVMMRASVLRHVVGQWDSWKTAESFQTFIGSESPRLHGGPAGTSLLRSMTGPDRHPACKSDFIRTNQCGGVGGAENVVVVVVVVVVFYLPYLADPLASTRELSLFPLRCPLYEWMNFSFNAFQVEKIATAIRFRVLCSRTCTEKGWVDWVLDPVLPRPFPLWSSRVKFQIMPVLLTQDMIILPEISLKALDKG